MIMNVRKYKLILASISLNRLELLKQVRINPYKVLPVAINETPRKQEQPDLLALRLGTEKAAKAKALLEEHESDDVFVLAADTVVSLGRRIIPKPKSREEACDILNFLSGRKHTVSTGVCLISPSGQNRKRLVVTKVFFKRLSFSEIQSYVNSSEWNEKPGGYAIQGFAGCFVRKLLGSYSNVVGLPLYETVLLLSGEGFPVFSD